jgi:Preprotein translocase subunit Sec63
VRVLPFLDCQLDTNFKYHERRLTDETIRKNWELYGHPDGRQEMSMGIALPHWIIEGKNNIWVLGIYGIIFGGALPALVVCLLSNSIFATLTMLPVGTLVVR